MGKTQKKFSKNERIAQLLEKEEPQVYLRLSTDLRRQAGPKIPAKLRTKLKKKFKQLAAGRKLTASYKDMFIVQATSELDCGDAYIDRDSLRLFPLALPRARLGPIREKKLVEELDKIVNGDRDFLCIDALGDQVLDGPEFKSFKKEVDQFWDEVDAAEEKYDDFGPAEFF